MFSLIAAGIVALAGTANPPVEMRAAEASCAQIDNGRYSVANCWSCFRKLLADCDTGAGEETSDRRRACYQAANNFFTFCLGRVNQAPGNRKAVGPQSMVPGEGYTFTAVFGAEIKAQNIIVTVRTIQDGAVVEQVANTWVAANRDGSFEIMLDDSNIKIGDNTSVGVVVAATNDKNQVIDAVAMVVDVQDPADLNRDGAIDNQDMTALWEMYANGKIDHVDFVDVAERIAK